MIRNSDGDEIVVDDFGDGRLFLLVTEARPGPRDPVGVAGAALHPTEARELAAELLAAADEAERKA